MTAATPTADDLAPVAAAPDPAVLDALVALADPEAKAAPPADIPARALSALALRHGVGGTVARRLGPGLFAPAYADLRSGVETLAALTLALQRWQARLAPAFAAAGMRADFVKGADFAGALYPVAGDRPFTDLDLLAHPDDLPGLAGILRDHGLRPDTGRSPARADALAERKWRHPDQPWLLVETHSDLVHYPGLRRRVSFGWAAATDGGAITPMARFLTACVHGALGHKFHQMRLVVDALQAFRRLDHDARAALPGIAARSGLRLEVAVTLAILAALYDVPQARALARRIAPAGAVRAANWLDRATVLGSGPAWRSRLRRHGLRAVQRMIPR